MILGFRAWCFLFYLGGRLHITISYHYLFIGLFNNFFRYNLFGNQANKCCFSDRSDGHDRTAIRNLESVRTAQEYILLTYLRNSESTLIGTIDLQTGESNSKATLSDITIGSYLQVQLSSDRSIYAIVVMKFDANVKNTSIEAIPTDFWFDQLT